MRDLRQALIPGYCVARGMDCLRWLLVVVAAAATLLGFAPGLLNRQLLAVRGGSMEPSFTAGDALLTRPLKDPAAEIAPGDVVIVHSPDGRVIQAHRVLLKVTDSDGQTLFKTAGDANATPDPGWASASNVSARVVAIFPRLGGLLGFLGQPSARLLFFVVPLLYIGLKTLHAGLYAEEEAEPA
jgi:signal peptidase I